MPDEEIQGELVEPPVGVGHLARVVQRRRDRDATVRHGQHAHALAGQALVLGLQRSGAASSNALGRRPSVEAVGRAGQHHVGGALHEADDVVDRPDGRWP